MFFKQIRCGGDRNFGYLIADEETRQCALVDPSPDPEPALGIVQEQRLLLYVALMQNSTMRFFGLKSVFPHNRFFRLWQEIDIKREK